MRTVHLAALMTAALALAGCASKEASKDDQGLIGIEVPYNASVIYVPQRLAHEFYSSWGHTGRGGAALRKPTYQHVMGSEDMVFTASGPYRDSNAETETPDGVIITTLNATPNAVITSALERAPAAPVIAAQPAPAGKYMNASADDYNRAYRKFCQGATNQMSEQEWEIVALGGPNAIPAQLRGRCMHSK